MKNKLFLLLFLGMFLISFASASLGEYDLGNCVQINTMLNTSSVTLSSITYPNGTTDFSIRPMTKNGLTFNYTFCDTSTYGEYNYDYNDSSGNTYVNDFRIGHTLDLSVAILFSFILLCLFVFIYFSFSGIFNSSKAEWEIFYICLTYLLLFSTFFLLWIISNNYLYEVPILERIFWIIWLVLSILFFPFVIIVSSYLLKKQAEMLLEEDLVKEGYTREEANEMAKKRKR